MPTAIELAQQFRARLETQEVDTAERMALAYNRIYTGLQDELKSLADEIAAMDKPDKNSLLELARLNRLLSQVEDELNKFGVTVTNEIELIQQRAITQASNDALALIEAAAPGISRDIILSFTKLPTNAIISAAGLVGDDSPLTARLTSAFGEYIAGQVRNGILTGVGIGKNPRDVYQILKRNFERSLGSGLTSALTTIRTAQIKSYQLASHASYQANSDIVTGWVWYSALQPGRTCMSCISKHGTVHPVTETLRDHHNGRCLVLGSMVSTWHGEKEIESVKSGDYVLTHKGRYKRVISISKRSYQGDVICVNGVYSTPEHPFLTERGWVEAKDLIQDDILFMLYSSLARLSNLNTVQPIEVNTLSFLRSIGRFFGELCQRGSSSTANIIEGKAKSILKLLTASCGVGNKPCEFNEDKKDNSPSDENSRQLLSRHFAKDIARFFRACGLCNVSSKKSGLFSSWRKNASLDEIGSILHNFISFMRERVLIPISAVISRYVAFSSMYFLCSQPSIGSPSFNDNSLRHFSVCINPLSFGDFFKPNTLARCKTALRVLSGNISAIAYESMLQKLSKITLSSSFVHFINNLLMYGTIIHRPIENCNILPYDGNVYNLHIEDDESYIANGVVVHNCTPIPITRYSSTPIQSGQDWFKGQPKQTQRSMMGGSMYDAWKKEQFDFAELSRTYDDGVYGELFREASLKDILGAKAKEYYS